MNVDANDLKRMGRFIDRYLPDHGLPCSVCGAKEWLFAGIYGTPRVDLATHTIYDRDSAPLALLACRRCTAVQFFSWHLIQEKTKDEVFP